MTHNDKKKAINAEAKTNGLYFKWQNATINGKQAYRFEDRETGLTVAVNYTVASAYTAVGEGEIVSYRRIQVLTNQ